jgi:branched-chain amino acid transport system substrate-binding protein
MKRIKSRKLLLTLSTICVILASVMTLLPGCSKTTTTTTSKTTSAANAKAPVAVKEWDFPMMSSLTGALAGPAGDALWAAKYAADEINAAGGIRGVPIKITGSDDALSPAQGVSVAAQVVPGSLALFGPFSSAVTQAIAQTITTNHTLCFGQANAPVLRTALTPYICANQQDFDQSTYLTVVRWLQLNPSIKKIAFFANSTTADPAATVLPPMFAKLGITTQVIAISYSQLDFSPQVDQAIAAGCQGFLDWNLGPGHVLVAKALYNRGITQGTELFSPYPADDPSLFNAGKGYLENSYVQLNCNPLGTSTAYKKLVEAHKAAFNGAPPTNNMGYYDIVYAIKNAIETLGITGDPSKLDAERQAIAGYLSNSPVLHGILYDYQWINGQMVAPIFLMQIKNNQYVYVETLTPNGASY